jgi:hypothetical protein
MFSMLLSLLIALGPLPARQSVSPLAYEVRAASNLLFGKGNTTGRDYYDVIITRQPTSGIFVKLDYSRRDTKFSFDLHHRIPMDASFGLPAEVITTVEVISGGTTSLGVFSIASTIKEGDVFEESVAKVSMAEVDRYVTPLGRRTVVLNTVPGSQSLSIVGRSVTVTRGTRTERRESPNSRIAVVSNFKFEENRPGTLLEVD